MQQYLDAINNSLEQKNWLSALAVSLTLPDICVWLEHGKQMRGPAYIEWCRKYLQPIYTRKVGAYAIEKVFLHAEDVYALRCAFLHRGTMDITEQAAKLALENFRFLEPLPGWSIHCNLHEGKHLQLQVDLFCKDVISAGGIWIRTVHDVRQDVRERVKALARIEKIERGFRM